MYVECTPTVVDEHDLSFVTSETRLTRHDGNRTLERHVNNASVYVWREEGRFNRSELRVDVDIESIVASTRLFMLSWEI